MSNLHKVHAPTARSSLTVLACLSWWSHVMARFTPHPDFVPGPGRFLASRSGRQRAGMGARRGPGPNRSAPSVWASVLTCAQTCAVLCTVARHYTRVPLPADPSNLYMSRGAGTAGKVGRSWDVSTYACIQAPTQPTSPSLRCEWVLAHGLDRTGRAGVRPGPRAERA